MTHTSSPRYIPLCPKGSTTPILYIDAHAPIDELRAFAEQRVRSVVQMLDSLSLTATDALEARDLALIAQLTSQMLEESCEVMAMLQERLQKQAV